MKYDESKIRITTVRLQDEILNELKRLNLEWSIEAKRHGDGQQMSISAVLRCLLEVTMPFIEEMEEVRNEEDFIEKIKHHIS